MTVAASVECRKRSRQVPLTPPSTLKKAKVESRIGKNGIEPKDLLGQLKKNSRKPRLKYRPDQCTIFNIDEYVADSDDSDRKCDADKNAEFLRYALIHSRRAVVVTGAGVSVAAGIPDFRSSNGLFSSLQSAKVSNGKELFDFHRVYADDEMNLQFNAMINSLHQLSAKSKPTHFHKLLDRLSLEGRLQRLYTQNIDDLDTQLPNLLTKVPLDTPAPKTIQLHGSINYMECNKCLKVVSLNPTLFKCSSSDKDGKKSIVPLCQYCTEMEQVRKVGGLRLKGIGRLRPKIVLYNEIHPEGDIIGEIVSSDIRKRPDCLIIAGTSMAIPGVKYMVRQFVQKVRSVNGIVIFINKEPPSKSVLDSMGNPDLIVTGDCQNVPILMNDF